MQEELRQDKLVLDNNKFLTINGVEGVDAFSEENLKLTVNANKLLITGENIKITSFNKTSGVLSAEGTFYEIKYARKKMPIIKRLFK